MVQVQTLSKGEQTRERLLDIAQDAVLHKGFAGTSLDEIICEAGITKSGFFYHFRDKNDLAKALLQRYLRPNEWKHVRGASSRQADDLSDDPLHGLSDLPEAIRGSAWAIIPEWASGLFDRVLCLSRLSCSAGEVRAHNDRRSSQIWRKRFRERLDKHRGALSGEVSKSISNDMADMLSAVADGGIILVEELAAIPDLLPRQSHAIPRLREAGFPRQLSRCGRRCFRHGRQAAE